MNQLLNPSLSKNQEPTRLKMFDMMLSQLRENNRATQEIHKEIQKLKRSNDRSFNRAKKAVEALENY